MSFCRIFHSIFSAITFFLYEASVTVTDHSVNTAGRVYILEYSVGGMNQSVIYQWLDREGSPITTGNSIPLPSQRQPAFSISLLFINLMRAITPAVLLPLKLWSQNPFMYLLKVSLL